MTPLVVVIAILYMPWDPITSVKDWYAPTIEIIQTEPSLEDIELELIRRQFRIMEVLECNE